MSQRRRGAILIRVSTEEQKRSSTSPDTQYEECLAVAQRLDVAIDEDHVFRDLAVSGGLASRDGIEAVLAGCRAGEIDVVIAYALDRVYRNELSFHSLIAELDRLNVELVFATQNFEPTPEGDLFRSVVASLAVYQRKHIRADMERGQRAVAARGYWPSGTPPFGYQVQEEGPRKRLMINEAEAAVVRQAVAFLVDDGLSSTEAAERLNGLGLYPRGARRRDEPTVPGRWTYKTLRRWAEEASWLSGTYVWGKTSKRGIQPIEIPVPALIAPDRHEALRRALARTSTGPRRADHRLYPLSRRVICRCGRPMTGVYVSREKEGWKSYPLYRCQGWQAPRSCCEKRQQADYLESVVWDAVCQLLTEPDRLLALCGAFLSQRAEQSGLERATRDSLERKLQDLRRARVRLMVEGAKAGLNAQALAEGDKELSADIEAMEAHVAQQTAWEEANRTESDRVRQLWALAERARSSLANMTAADQADIYELLDLTVTVLDPGKRGERPNIRLEGVVSESLLQGDNAARVHSGDRFFRTAGGTTPATDLAFAISVP